MIKLAYFILGYIFWFFKKILGDFFKVLLNNHKKYKLKFVCLNPKLIND